MIGRLDRAKDRIQMLYELGMTGAVRLSADDMRPAFLGQLDGATVDIYHRREHRHGNAVLDRPPFPFRTLGSVRGVNAPTYRRRADRRLALTDRRRTVVDFAGRPADAAPRLVTAHPSA
jgi:hypothetical protein